MKLHKAFLIGAVVSLGAAALLGIVALLGMRGQATWQTLASVASFGYFSLASLVCAFSIDKVRLVRFAWVGIVVSWLAFVFTVLMIWVDPWLHRVFPGTVEEQLCATGFYVSFFASHICLLWLSRRVEKWSARVRWTASVSAVILLIMFFDVVFEITPWTRSYEEFYARIFGAVAIVAASTSVVLPLLLRFEGIRRQENISTTELSIHLKCPRCGCDQIMQSGKARCKQCRLHFRIEIEEPSCTQCGYVLYRPESHTCPECGEPIPPDDRWAVVEETSAEAEADSPETT